MKFFNPINRDYVAPVELSVVDKSFTTLEQGHKEAVKTASELRKSIATLNLNEAEDEWKINKANEVNEILENNSRYGNAYSALDDLVLQGTELLTGADTLGRVRAQEDYLKFINSVDNSNISDGMKEMYKDKNKYYYEDKYDDNGRVIGGSKWKPNDTPVTHIDFNAAQQKILSYIAKEAGGYDNITYIDNNGNPTKDPNKSNGMGYHVKTSTGYQRLPAEKIEKAINSAIDSIPGLRDSLNQEYDYNMWVKDKIDEGEERDIDSDFITNGIINSREQWLNNRIKNFADVTSYNHVTTQTDVGDALYKHLQLQASRAANQRAGAGSGDGASLPTGEDPQAIHGVASNVGTATVQVDVLNGYAKTKNESGNYIKSAIEQLTGSKFKTTDDSINSIQRVAPGKRFAPGQLANTIIKQGNIKDVDAIKNIKKAAMNYYTYGKLVDSYMNKLNREQKDAFKAYVSAANGGEFSNDTKTGKRINNAVNRAFGGTDYIKVALDDDMVNALSKHSGDIISGNKTGYVFTKNSDGSGTLIIRREAGRGVLELKGILDKATENTGFWDKDKFANLFTGGGFKGYEITGLKRQKDGSLKEYSLNVHDNYNTGSKNNKSISDRRAKTERDYGNWWSRTTNRVSNFFKGAFDGVVFGNTTVDNAARVYEAEMDYINKTLQHSKAAQEAVVNIRSNGHSTTKGLMYSMMHENGQITDEQYYKYVKEADDAVLNSIVSIGKNDIKIQDLTSGHLTNLSEDDMVAMYNEFTAAKQNGKIASVLEARYNGGVGSKNGQVNGYKIKFVNADDKVREIFVTGNINELNAFAGKTLYDHVYNIVETSKKTNSFIPLGLDYDLSSTGIGYDKGVGYFKLGKIVRQMSDDDLNKITTRLVALNDVKEGIKDGDIQNNKAAVTTITTELQRIINMLGLSNEEVNYAVPLLKNWLNDIQ